MTFLSFFSAKISRRAEQGTAGSYRHKGGCIMQGWTKGAERIDTYSATCVGT